MLHVFLNTALYRLLAFREGLEIFRHLGGAGRKIVRTNSWWRWEVIIIHYRTRFLIGRSLSCTKKNIESDFYKILIYILHSVIETHSSKSTFVWFKMSKMLFHGQYFYYKAKKTGGKLAGGRVKNQKLVVTIYFQIRKRYKNGHYFKFLGVHLNCKLTWESHIRV